LSRHPDKRKGINRFTLRESQVMGDNLSRLTPPALMQGPFLILLLALSANVVGMLLLYSWMAWAFLRLHWHGRGLAGALVALLAASIFWIGPTMMAPDAHSAGLLAFPLWFGNWFVGAFSVIVLCQAVKRIPRQLEDSARLDGLGALGTWWHVLLPLVRRELGLIAVLTLMGTATLCWSALTLPSPIGIAPPWLPLLAAINDHPGAGPVRLLLIMIAGSLVAALPLILLFFFAKRDFQDATRADEADITPSTR
jgi:multiple sugar transport system permease protein